MARRDSKLKVARIFQGLKNLFRALKDASKCQEILNVRTFRHAKFRRNKEHEKKREEKFKIRNELSYILKTKDEKFILKFEDPVFSN